MTSGERLATRVCEAASDPQKVAAIEALALLGDARTEHVLIAALHDPSLWVRTVAGRALARIGGEAVTRALGTRLRDPDTGVCLTAFAALGEIGDDAAIDELLEAFAGEAYRQNALMFLPAGARTRSTILAAISDPDSDVRFMAAVRAREFGSDAVPTLVHALQDSSPSVREVAGEVLGEIGTSEAREALLDFLAERGVVEYEQSDLGGALRDAALHAEDDAIGSAALAFLFVSQGRSSCEIAAEVWRESSGRGSRAGCAAKMLSRSGDEGNEVLVDAYCGAGLFERQDPHSRPSTRYAEVMELRSRLKIRRTAAAYLRRDRRGRALRELDRTLVHETITSDQSAAAHALGRLGGEDALASLVGAANASAGALRESIAEALGDLGDARAIDSLGRYLAGTLRFGRYPSGDRSRKNRGAPGI